MPSSEVRRITVRGRLCQDSCSDLSIDGFSDAQLSELALSADMDRLLPDDAVAIRLSPLDSSSLLGAWYMPPVATRRVAGWRRWVMFLIVATFLILEALGLCSVFGQVVIG